LAALTLISDIGSHAIGLARCCYLFNSRFSALDFQLIKADVEQFSIAEAVFVLHEVIGDFPENSIHILDVENDLYRYKRILVIRYKKQWILGADNGFAGMLKISEHDVFAFLPKKEMNLNNALMYVYPEVINLLLRKEHHLLDSCKNYQSLQNIQPVFNGAELRGTIIFVDEFGNSISNITKELFDTYIGTKPFQIKLNRHEKIRKFHNHFGEVPDGEKLCMWTESSYLQIAINRGSASMLLGLDKGKMITIEIEQKYDLQISKNDF
jgi:S-adenosylmethionine hydrolase